MEAEKAMETAMEVEAAVEAGGRGGAETSSLTIATFLSPNFIFLLVLIFFPYFF